MLQIDPSGDLRIIDLATGRDISVTGTAVGAINSGALLWVITADSPVVEVAFSPDGRRVIVSSQNGRIYIADSRTGQIIR